MKDADLLKRVPGGDRVHEKESLASSHVLLPHGSVLLLSGGVQDVEESDLVVNDALLAVRVFDGRVVLVYKVGLDELNGEGGFTDTSSTNNDKLVLPQELGPSCHFSGQSL